ncbi:MAG: PAS domain S-box protein [Acidobacteria bacterium]|nr:PAS domain S-box protein [Acidobacteriota bacterium]
MNDLQNGFAVERLRRELDASERRLRSIINHNPDSILVLDQEGVVLFANPAADALFGWGGRLQGHVFGFPTVAGETTEIDIAAHGRNARQVEMRVSATEWDGRSAMMATLRDITDRKASERALRDSEFRYRQAFDQALTANYISDPAGGLLASNATFLRIFGFESEQEACEAGVPALFGNPAKHAEIVEAVRRHRALRGVEIEMTHHNGAIVHVIGNVFGSFDANGNLEALTAFLLDVSEWRSLEAQLRHAQKMEAIGRLAGGLAHDFNNLLTVVTGYGSLLLNRLPATDRLRQCAVEIVDAADRAAALTSRLLTFGRRQFTQPALFRLDELLDSIAPLLRSAAGDDIELRLSATGGGVIFADRSQIEQVIMNLVVNARDAMPDGGVMTVRSLLQGEADLPVGLGPGSRVLLEVSDTGHGMTPEVRSRLFEPFFTTKSQGKGTGLGLSIVYGIVKRAGGEVLVESQPEQGAVFRVYFPEVQGEPAVPAPVAEPALPRRGTETILLIDDDPNLRRLAVSVLHDAGYRVLEATDALHAIRIAEETPIDLLLTDVLMPGMNGRNLAAKVLGMRPNSRVLYISGFNEDATLLQGVYEPGASFLRKPFTPAQLERNVREILDRPHGVAAAAATGA